VITVSDDRMILIVALAFFIGGVWGWWLRHMDCQSDKHYENH
jgi:hypothetical protein